MFSRPDAAVTVVGIMPLPLDKSLKREVVIDGRPHTVTIGPKGVKVTAKGFRKGRALSWRDVIALGREEGPTGQDERA
jgi:hypothetical protein